MKYKYGASNRGGNLYDDPAKNSNCNPFDSIRTALKKESNPMNTKTVAIPPDSTIIATDCSQ